MKMRILNNPIVQISSFILVGLCVLAIIFPRFFIYPISSLSNYANQFMLLLLIGGLLSLLLRQPRLTFLCFGASATICVFLKNNNNSDVIKRWRDRLSPEAVVLYPTSPIDEKLLVAHLNLSNVTDIDSTLKAMRNCGADLISLHEVNPMWELILKEQLADLYPFQEFYVDVGLHGLGIISNYNLEGADTLYFEGIPALRMAINFSGQDLRVFSLRSEPLIQESARQKLLLQLDAMSEIISHDSLPGIVFGEFNLVTWSSELQEFCRRTGLHESRSGFMHYVSKNIGSMWEAPFDHIFFTSPLQVVEIQNFNEPGSGKRLGLIGAYHFHNGITYAN